MVLAAVRGAANALALRDTAVLVAVSGGVDSTVLLDALHALAPELGLRLSVGHVNHGLRGEGADGDEAFVKDLAAGRGLPFLVRRVAPRELREGGPSRSRPTLQEAARTLRYGALQAMAAEAGAACIATAHTLDDQAETVLLRLLRGTGPDGLGGIPERSPDGRVVRPLLGVSRAQVEHHARGRGLCWREDPSNADPRYARARLRRDWLPGLGEAFNPLWLRAIGDLAEAQRQEAAWIGELVQREAQGRFVREGGGLRIATAGFAELPEALARRLAREALHRLGAGRDVSRVHLERMVRFLRAGRGGRRLELPGGLVLRITRGSALLERPVGTPPAGC